MRILLLALIAASVLFGGEPQTTADIEAELWNMVPEKWRPTSPVANQGRDSGELIIAAGSPVNGPSVDEEPLWQAYLAASSWKKPWPTGGSAEVLLTWLDAPGRAGSAAILDQALALGARRPAARNASDPVIGPGRDLMRYLVIRCRRAVETGDLTQAEDELRRISGLCRIMRGGYGGIGLLIDISLAAYAIDAVVGVAVKAPPDPVVIERLRKLVPPAEDLSVDFIPRMLLGDLIPSLATSPVDGDLWVQNLQGMHLNSALLREKMRDTTGATTPASDRSAIFALAGNPVALDRKETVRLALAMLTAISSSDGKAAWKQGPVRDLVDDTQHASGHLFPAADLMNDVIGSVGKGGNTQEAQAEAARRADADFRRLAAQPNPVGKITVGIQLSALPMLLDSGSGNAARIRMAHLALSLLDHRARHGAFPVELPADAPTDPFSHAPFRWDASRRLLWSVGKNGTDEQGDRRKDDVMRLHAEPDP